MAKSRAEIQKAYREKKKAEKGHDYFKQEAKRVKKYYVPTAKLSRQKLRKRRSKIRNAMKEKRLREKNTEVSNNSNVVVNNEEMMDIDTENGPCDSTTAAIVHSSAQVPSSSEEKTTPANKLVVKMKFSHSGKGRKKMPKPLKKAESKIRKLTHNLDKVRRRNIVLRQRLSRINKRKMKQTDTSSTELSDSTIHVFPDGTPKQQDSTPLTPRSRSRTLMRSSGISPRRHRSIAKKLLLHESMVDDMKKKDSAVNIVCGKTTRMYRQVSAISHTLDMNRHKVLRKVRGPTTMQRRKAVEKARVKAKVIEFMERDDNSACLPGKADCLKTANGTKQKRVLNDLLHNLHLKFRSENTDIKINLSTFGSHRPKNIKLVHYSSRKTCLCQRHQNLALKVKGLRTIGITNVTTPDSYIKQATDEELISQIEQNDCTSIKYTEWQRVETEHKGRKIKRMQVVQVIKAKTEFVDIMKKEIPNFRSHCQRVKIQYEEVKRLKDKLPADQAIVQMDFAENYICSHADEVQSAYFDKGTVTLHPTVIYHKNSENKLEHDSRVIVSDTPMHNSGTVLAIIREIIPIVRQLVPNLRTIHYVTDSPTSQYRNKHMFYVISNHDSMFEGITASWQYFEAGHGKGPCDGVGGTAKRQADSAVKRQICSIQNAEDFYAWGLAQEHSNMKYMYVSNTECNDALDSLRRLNTKPVKGTMSVHSVVALGNNCIAIRDTSCFCDKCFSDGTFYATCGGWKKHCFTDIEDSSSANHDVDHTIEDIGAEVNIASVDKVVEDISDKAVEQHYFTNSYVAALYDRKWYIGKILDYDPDDDTYQISFMTEGSNQRGPSFKWPEREDILWLPKSSIVCAVDEPILYGKTRRLYKLSSEDLERVVNLYKF